MDVDGLNKILDKCEIYLEGQLISREFILQQFLKFLSDEAGKDENHGSIILHVGSPCFEAVAVAWSAFAVIIGSGTDVEKIVRSLCIGDQVLYEGKPGEFGGIETESTGKERAVVYQGYKRAIGRKNWASIVPYYGQSRCYDGRGMRSRNGKREEFLSKVLGCDKKDIPGITDSSIILVMDRYKADRYINGLEIQYDDYRIQILELVTASYLTDGNEYRYRGNTGKNEAMLKFTSRISVGLDQTWKTEGNAHLGMFVCGNSLIERGNDSMEINQAMNREMFSFSFICGGMDLFCSESLVNGHEESGVFICTKDFLLENSLPLKEVNDLTKELNKQIEAVIDHEVLTEILPGEISWQDYRDFKTAIDLIRRDELEEGEKSSIIISAWSLMKLFMTAPFSLNEMEMAIKEGRIHAEEPVEMLKKLEEKLKRLPDNLQKSGNKIADVLETMYYARCDESPKRKFVRSFVKKRRKKKIAVIVPKPYYADIMWDYILNDCNLDTSRVEIVSVNRFDGSRMYDDILLVGNITGKRFDVFRCVAAPEITVLLYEPEAVVFRVRGRQGTKRDRLFNSRQQIIEEISETSVEDNLLMEEAKRVDRVDDEIIQYSENVIAGNFDAVIRQGNGDSSAPLADVTTLVRFEDGEGAMLTKFYEAYVLNDAKREVEQKKAADLNVGDILVFLNRDNDTRDIVDYILNEMILSGQSAEGFSERYSMSRQWKIDLVEYMKRTRETPGQIVKKMIANGVSVQPVTIKNWLNEEAHIVGPQKVEYLEQIALLTENSDMFDHVNEYFEACRDVRKVRKDILEELGTAIIRRIEGVNATDGTIPPEIQERLDTMAAVLRIENIVKTNRTVPAYMTNRPIDLEGGL